MSLDANSFSPAENLGKKGEDLARHYLLGKGYRILASNWRSGHREIDIIARQADEIVVVEVKTRDENHACEPWEAVTTGKIRNIVEAADHWIIEHGIDLECRFDVISIVIDRMGGSQLEHFEGAFIPPVN